MKFSTIALIGAASATTAQERLANNLRVNAKEHYQRAALEAADTAQDVHRIHKRFAGAQIRDFKRTLQVEKRFWNKSPEVW